ncbi:MAG: Hsp70 family protein [Methylococcales bacterium]|nr:Hsp70 family protein [Methylococcales bacterium]
MTQARFQVGIDLGTTHTAVAYVEPGQTEIRLLPVEQLIAPGEVAARPLLPSVRYHLAEGELADSDLIYQHQGAILGEAARLLGAKSQGRLVTSAKSWLSHPGVDPKQAILPWAAAEAIDKISPVDASAGYLAHIASIWRHRFPQAPLPEQDIVLTVPASFDQGARALTLEAARLAGLTRVRLLEEPQAVMYDWLRRQGDQVGQALSDVKLLLILDVGGGTTDLTLIQVEATDTDSQPKLTRIGVGDHLLLGGDNIDLTLARRLETRLAGEGRRLSAVELAQLLEQCRIAKEKLLAEAAPPQYPVTLLGGGSRLIGGARTVNLGREDVLNIVLDGFLPLTGLDDVPERLRSGVVELGLHYATEAAFSKHIAEFLQRYRQVAMAATGADVPAPDAVLLNGGLFNSRALSARVESLLCGWRGQAIKRLDNPRPELAVALGAAAFALTLRDRTLKIGGGAARSYFLRVEADGYQQQGVCLLPSGTEEEREVILPERSFALRVGQPVRFDLLSLTGDGVYQPGALVTLDQERCQALPPLTLALPGTPGETETVQLAATLTEIGSLRLQCLSTADVSRRWDVEFQLRGGVSSSDSTFQQPASWPQVVELISQVYGSKSKSVDPKAVRALRAALEKHLGAREQWPTALLRALFGLLLDGAKYRRRSAFHERVWFNLAGFCLRPGFGDALDDWRMGEILPLYGKGLQFVDEAQNWSEWWTFWRRIAGGLDEATQQALLRDLSKFLDPASARQAGIAKQLKLKSLEDMARLAGSLERLPLNNKQLLGEWLCTSLKKTKAPAALWWALGRVGARQLLHGSDHLVLPQEAIMPWLEHALAADWEAFPESRFAAVSLSRRVGDRMRDVDDATRQKVIDRLEKIKAPASWIDWMTTPEALDAQQQQQIFGEALPPGLKLMR